MNAQFVSFWSGDYPQFAPAYADELAAITGSMSVAETGDDTFSASGQVLIQGTLSATETDQDAATIIGQILVSGLMDVSEVGDDVFAAIGVVTDTAPITAAEVARTVRATARMRTVKYEVARA
jgi:hypothetical protein